VWVCLVAGCWNEQLVDGAFTADQWAHFQAELLLRPKPSSACGVASLPQAAHDLGQMLFQDPTLSGNGTLSCQTCHDPKHGWIDSRVPDNVSQGATGFTKHNALTMLNLAYKLGHANANTFTWVGQFDNPGDVITKIAIPKAMGGSITQVQSAINNNYGLLQMAAFGGATPTEQTIAQAFVAYVCTDPLFTTNHTPFDHYLLGDDQASAMSDSAKRGFAVFVGRGTCIECHNGPMLTDYDFHATGAPQQGDHVVAVDNGLADTTGNAADTGKFLVPSLREVAHTGPYMHDGVFATLAEVIAFYRSGGVAAGYNGVKDPRIVPLDLDDNDARDLEAFLNALSQCDGTKCAP
jgi:cytochrome c peroxidase